MYIYIYIFIACQGTEFSTKQRGFFVPFFEKPLKAGPEVPVTDQALASEAEFIIGGPTEVIGW